MENASKALIIASGVLMGVMILSLMVFLFVDFGQRAKEMQDKIQASQITEFNNRFTKYSDQQIATIYDVISVAKFANEYNTVNNLDENNSLKIYFGNSISPANRLDSNIDTIKQQQLIKTYMNDIYLGEDTVNLTYGFKQDALFWCKILDEYDTSGRILGVIFSKQKL